MKGDAPKPIGQATVAIQSVHIIALGAAMFEVELGPMLAKVGLTDLPLEDMDARIPVRAALDLWAELGARCALPHAGLLLAERLLDSAMPTLGAHLVQSAPTLGEGLSRLVSLERAFHGTDSTRLERRGDVARIEHRAPIDAGPGAELAIDFGFGWILGTARRTTRRAIVPRAVALTRAPPRDPSPYLERFGVMPTFGHALDVLELSAGDLDCEQHTRDEVVARLTESHARALLDRLPDTDGWASRVGSVIAEHFASACGEPVSLEDVAAKLSLPERTLQRRLADEATTFAAVLEDVKKSLARHHLRTPAALAEIAYLLGFSDQAAFHRAFVRWTGVTPGAFRKRALG